MGDQGTEKSYDLGTYQRILLETTNVFYFTARNGAIPLMQLYVYDLYKKKYGLDDIDNNANATLVPFSDDGPQYLTDKANEEASELCLYLAIAELFPSMLSTLLLGFLSDVTGKRKFLLWLPCLGNAMYALFFALPLYINGGDVNEPVTVALLVIGCVFSGACGSFPGYFSGNVIYIAYTDSEERRTLRLAQVEFIVGLTFAISNLAYGAWVDATGDYLQPIWFIIACSTTAFVLMLLLVKEPLRGTEGLESPMETIRSIREVAGCSTTTQRQLWAVCVTFLIYVFIQQGQERVYVLFLSEDPFYWDIIQIGLFFFILYVLAALGAYPGISLLQRVASDIFIVFLALVCKLLSSIMLVFAQTNVPVYLECACFHIYTAAAVQILLLAPFIITKSIVSQRAPEDKQGSIMSMLMTLTAVSSFFGPVTLNAIFVASTANAVVFTFSAALLAVASCLIAYAQYLGSVPKAAEREENLPLSLDKSHATYTGSGQ